MKRLLLLLVSAGCLSLAAQQDIYTDFDNYSFHPGLADPDHVLEADLFLRSDFSRFYGSPVDLSAQVNHWFGGRHNAGLSLQYSHIGSRLSYHTKGSYAYRFSLSEWQIQPVVQASVAYYTMNTSRYIPPPNIQPLTASVTTASMGVGVHYRKFSGGIFLPYLMQWSGQDMHQLNPSVRVHLEHEFAIGNHLEAKPFLRAVAQQYARLTSGFSAKYGDRVELLGAYTILNTGNALRIGGGAHLMSGMWLRYQHQLLMGDYHENARPSHLLALSFDLAANRE